MKSLKELAIEALEIQNACNLCGLVQRFAEVQKELAQHVQGTEERNTHFITIMWLDKFNSLSHIQFDQFKIGKAYNDCSDLAKEVSNANN